MPIQYPATSAVFREASYTVEVWLQEVSQGIRVYPTTAASDVSGSIADYVVSMWHNACIHALLPYYTSSGSMRLRDLRSIDPSCSGYPTFLDYARNPPAQCVRIYTG